MSNTLECKAEVTVIRFEFGSLIAASIVKLVSQSLNHLYAVTTCFYQIL